MKTAAPPVWVSTFRQQLVEVVGPEWQVVEHRGRIRLVRSLVGGGKDRLMLSYPWEPRSTVNVLQRVQAVAELVAEGLTLAEANKQIENRTIGPGGSRLDWPAAAAAFERHKVVQSAAVTERTWRLKYQPVIDSLLVSMASARRPANVNDAVDAAVARWEAGTRSRQIAVQSISQFLSYCVERQAFPSSWRPGPARLYVGARKVAKRVGYPLSDAQIIQLVESMPDGPWRFVVQLLAVYGLRPEDLRHLAIRSGVDGSELWSSYCKAGGGGRTEPRRLHPLPVVGIDGAQVWNLQDRLSVGESLPPLGQPGKAGEALGTHLRRMAVWKSIRAEVEAAGGTLTPYSFRHRYAATAHRVGLSVKDISEAMGHSVQSHLQAYANFASRSTATAFADAAVRLAAVASVPRVSPST
jgi:integrase